MNTKFHDSLKLRLRKLVSYGIWLMIIALGFSTIQNISKVVRTRDEIQKEKDRVAKMRDVNLSLEKQIAEAQSSAFIEKQVRDKLGLAKAGESVVILPDEDTLRKLAPQTSSEDNTLPDPNWKKWEKLFF